MARFSYSQFAEQILDNADEPILAVSMMREAIMDGAPHEGEQLRVKLRDACEGLANQSGYRRTRSKEVKGYLYSKVDSLDNDELPSNGPR